MALTFGTKKGDFTAATSDALIVSVGAGEAVPEGIARAFGGQLAGILEGHGFGGKKNDLVSFPTFQQLPVGTIVIAGTGDQEAGEDGRWRETLRRSYGAAVKRARDAGASTIAVVPPQNADAAAIGAVVEGMALALYRYMRYKSGEAVTPAREVTTIEVWSDNPEAEAAVRHGEAVAAGVALARDFVNTIAADKRPPQLAKEVQALAKEWELECHVLDRAALQAGGYRSILTVGMGSEADPQLIEMVYEPAGGATRTVALVGKTITFDSGGLDLKSADGMYAMKGDMGGGASVLGAMKAVALLQPKVRVIGIMSAAENMPSGTAMRPSDVVRALNGKTFEIGNTDAEGRMVLADAVTHAARAGADEIIDLATLTGAKVVALGTTVGVFSNDQEFADRFLAAVDSAGERAWQLPMWDEYREALKSDIADIKSTGGRGAGAITAALFISEFVEGKPWIHLDIAGSAMTDREGPYTPRGGTGVMVRSLVDYLESRAG